MSRSRTGVFSRDNYSETESVTIPDWFSEYSNNLQKISVQPAHKDRALFDQISEILGTKSRYATVEEAVQDLQDRTGLAKYLQMCKSDQEKMLNTKTAQDHSDESLEVVLNENTNSESELESEPSLLKSNPGIKEYINHFIESRYGFIHVPAVIDSIRTVFRNEDFASKDLEDENLRNYINDIIIKVKSLHTSDAGINTDLGKLDHLTENNSNNDAFSILMPANE